MDQDMNEILNKYVEDCLNSSLFAGKTEDEKTQLREKLTTHLQGVILHALVDSLNIEQLERFNQIDPNSDEAPVIVEQLASEVENFVGIADEAMKKEVENIKQSGNVPEINSPEDSNL